jgi:hypothetical protein
LRKVRCTATREKNLFFLYIWTDFGLTAHHKKASTFFLQEVLKKKYDLANNFSSDLDFNI